MDQCSIAALLAGQILFVTRNPHLKKCSIADFDGICSEKTFVIETKDESILTQEYLAIIMQSDDFGIIVKKIKVVVLITF